MSDKCENSSSRRALTSAAPPRPPARRHLGLKVHECVILVTDFTKPPSNQQRRIFSSLYGEDDATNKKRRSSQSRSLRKREAPRFIASKFVPDCTLKRTRVKRQTVVYEDGQRFRFESHRVVKRERGLLNTYNVTTDEQHHHDYICNLIESQPLFSSGSCTIDERPGHWRLHKEGLGLWLKPLIEQLLEGETSQSPPVVPAPATGLALSLGQLFGGKLPLTPDAALNVEIMNDHEALKQEGHTFMSAFRYCMEHWQKVRDSPLRRHTTNLLQIAVAMGFAPSNWSELTLGSINIYNVAVSNKFSDVGDCMDAVVMAVNYFVEAVVESWEVGNLLPFLRDRSLNARLDKMYSEIQEQMQWIEEGTFKDKGADWAVLYKHISICKKAFMAQESLVPPASYEKRYFSERVKTLQSWYMKVVMLRNNGENVAQTPAVIFCGFPGSGKSKLMADTLKLRAAMKGSEFDPSTVANAVVDDAFDSTMWNHTLFYVMDDIANRPLPLDPSKGIIKLLQLSNNVPYTATKAELEHKGVVQPQLWLVAGTTNVRHLNIDLVSNCPDSIKRRFYLVDVRVKKRFINATGGVNEELVNSMEDDGTLPMVEYAGNKFQDIYNITISKHSTQWQAMKYHGEKIAKRLSIAEYFRAMEDILAQHDRSQERHLNRIDSTLMPKKCGVCNSVECHCVAAVESALDSIMEYPSDAEEEEETDPPSLSTAVEQEAHLRKVLNMPVMTEENQGIVSRVLGIPTNLLELIEMTGDRITTAVGAEVSRQYVGGFWSFSGLMWHLGISDTTITTTTRSLVEHLAYKDYFQWWYYVPDDWWDTDTVKFLTTKFPDPGSARSMRRSLLLSRVCLGTTVLSLCGKRYAPAAFSSIGWLGCGLYNKIKREQMHYALTKRRDSMTEIAQNARNQRSPRVKTLLYALAGASGMAYLGKKLLDWYMDSREQDKVPTELEGAVPRKPPTAELETTNSFSHVDLKESNEAEQSYMECDEQEFKRREAVLDDWSTKVLAIRPVRNKTMTAEQFQRKVFKNITMVEEKGADGNFKFRCCVFWLKSGIFTVPIDDIPKTTTVWRMRDSDAPGCDSVYTISPESFTTFKDSKLVVGHLNYRSKEDLTSYLDINPSTYQGTVYLSKYWRDDSMHVLRDQVTVGRMETPDTHSMRVITWERLSESFAGQCGGVYVSPQNTIVGIHYAGIKENYRITRSHLLSKEDIDRALVQKFRCEGRLVMPNPPVKPREIFGKPLYDAQEETARPPGDIIDQVEYLKSATEENQGAQFKGTVPATAYYVSKVVPTIISEEVKERFPEQDFAGPKFGRSMYPRSAMYSFNNSPGLPRDLMLWARDDYLVAFDVVPEYLRKDLRPLTLDENLNGIDGKRFAEGLKVSTSAGPGMPGGKIQYIEEFTGEDGRVRRRLKPHVLQEYILAGDMLRQGYSLGFLFRTTPKDEATHVSKSKVRLFTVGELILVLYIRKHFVMVNRVIQFMTSRSECAVGVNCDSDDWESIWSFLEGFKRWFDLDYSKYDLRMDAETISTSYSLLCSIALAGNYSAEDLFEMNMLLGDIIWPMMIYSKFVYQLSGSWVSGIPITVIINSLNNSLMLRCAYKSIYPNAGVGTFRQNVRLLTYGDDVVAAVKWWASRFNFLSVKDFYAKHGIIITTGDKISEGSRFARDPNQLVFLQRYSTKLPGITFRVGRLKEASILKRLVAINTSSDVSVHELTCINIDSALFDYASHGEVIYEDRRKWLRKIATEKGIAHLCIRLNDSWRQTMRKKFPSFSL